MPPAEAVAAAVGEGGRKQRAVNRLGRLVIGVRISGGRAEVCGCCAGPRALCRHGPKRRGPEDAPLQCEQRRKRQRPI